MKGNFYASPTFPSNELLNNASEILPSPPENVSNYSTMMMEQSYIENILRLNKGKRINAYVSYPDSSEWQNKVYEGIIEQAGRDHLIISDPSNGHWYLIRLIYLDYVEFMEAINYNIY